MEPSHPPLSRCDLAQRHVLKVEEEQVDIDFTHTISDNHSVCIMSESVEFTFKFTFHLFPPLQMIDIHYSLVNVP